MSTKKIFLILSLLSLLVIAAQSPYDASLPDHNLDNTGASQKVQMDACQASKIIDRLYAVLTAGPYMKFGPVQGANGVISISDDKVIPSYHTQSVDQWLAENFPEIKSRKDLLSLIEQAGWKYRSTILSDDDYTKPADWKDPCAPKGGGGGQSLQFSAEYIWLLVLLALLILLGLAALLRFGGRSIPI